MASLVSLRCAASVGVHDIDSEERPADRRPRERDRLSVGRPGRTPSQPGSLVSFSLPAPVGVHDEDVARACHGQRRESDLLAVGRPAHDPGKRAPTFVSRSRRRS